MRAVVTGRAIQPDSVLEDTVTKQKPDAAREVQELAARLAAIEKNAADGARELADLKARRVSLIAEGEAVPEDLVARITAGAVALEGSASAAEVVRQRLVEAERRAKAEDRNRLLASFNEQEKRDRAALEEVDGLVRALAAGLTPIVATVRRTDELARQAGFGTVRGRLSNCIMYALTQHSVIDSREFNVPLSTLRRLAPAARVEVTS